MKTKIALIIGIMIFAWFGKVQVEWAIGAIVVVMIFL